MSDREFVLTTLHIHNLTQTWLRTLLARHGVEVGKVNLSDFLRGVRVNATSEKVLTESKRLLLAYAKWEESV